MSDVQRETAKGPRMKHAKKRNVGLVFEQLVGFVSESLVKGDRSAATQALDLIEKRFSTDSLLRRELRLFRALSDPRVDSVELATRILDEARTAAAEYDSRSLDREKTALVTEINRSFGGTEFYDRRVERYKTYATIQSLLNEWRSKSCPDPAAVSSYERVLVEWLTRKPEKIAENENKSVDPLAYKIMLEKFQEKWSGLSAEQKQMLHDYISQNESVITEQFARIKKQVVESVGCYKRECKNATLKEKHERVIKEVESLDPSDTSGTSFAKFMTAASLVEEIATDAAKEIVI